MITNEEARARVAIGAAYLDRARPGWHDLIDVGTLTLHDSCGCIVGQLCVSVMFDKGLSALGLELHGRDHGLDLSISEICGAPTRAAAYAPLQDAWIDAIAARRHPVAEHETTGPRDSQLTYAVARTAGDATG